MSYIVKYQLQAVSDLKKLDKQTQKRITNKITWLSRSDKVMGALNRLKALFCRH